MRIFFCNSEPPDIEDYFTIRCPNGTILSFIVILDDTIKFPKIVIKNKYRRLYKALEFLHPLKINSIKKSNCITKAVNWIGCYNQTNESFETNIIYTGKVELYSLLKNIGEFINCDY